MTIKKELIETFVVNITPEVFIDFPTCSALILPPSIHVIRFIIQIIYQINVWMFIASPHAIRASLNFIWKAINQY